MITVIWFWFSLVCYSYMQSNPARQTEVFVESLCQHQHAKCAVVVWSDKLVVPRFGCMQISWKPRFWYIWLLLNVMWGRYDYAFQLVLFLVTLKFCHVSPSFFCRTHWPPCIFVELRMKVEEFHQRLQCFRDVFKAAQNHGKHVLASLMDLEEKHDFWPFLFEHSLTQSFACSLFLLKLTSGGGDWWTSHWRFAAGCYWSATVKFADWCGDVSDYTKVLATLKLHRKKHQKMESEKQTPTRKE